MSNVDQFHFQNALFSDYPIIRKLLSLKTTDFIGPSYRKTHDAMSFFQIYVTHRIVVRKNRNDPDIVCYADFKHYPRILPMSINSWLDWIHHHFCTQLPMTKVNTMFMDYCMYNSTLNPDLLTNLLREVFLRERKLRYIVVVEMPRLEQKFREDEPNYEPFKSFSIIFYPKVFSVGSCSNTQKLYVIHRDAIIIKMRYRKALPEDNDDVVELIDMDLPWLKTQYGEYYIAEEIMMNDPQKTFIITEINHITVGFLWLNKDVNIKKLISNYELEPFGNLLKVISEERTKKNLIHVTETHRRDKSKLFRIEDIHGLFEEKKSLPMQIDREDWSSYASLDSINGNNTIEQQSKKNFVQFCWLPGCFERLQNVIDELKSNHYYFTNSARLMRVYNTSDFMSHSNAFAIQLVALHSSCDHREMFRFLIAAFSVFSDREYCIFALPLKWSMTLVIQELLRYFIPVLPRPGCEMDDLLYITHRSCLYGDITISRLSADDVEPIIAILNSKINEIRPMSSEASVQTDNPFDDQQTIELEKTLTNVKLVREIMEDILTNPLTLYKIATIRVGNSAAADKDNVVIGFIIIRKFDFMHFLNQKYRIPPMHSLISPLRYQIICAKLHPLFLSESDLIFRELARVCDAIHFLYCLPKSNKYQLLPNDLLSCMQPTQPKLIEKDWPASVKDFVPFTPPHPDEREINKIAIFDYSKEYFSLYMHNLKSTKIFGSRRSIVIIGFSDICKAFLRLKIFEFSHKDFENSQRFLCIPQHNIIVIANPGVVDGEFDVDFACEHCSDQKNCWLNWWNSDAFLRDTVLRMDLQKYIKFVSGSVRTIEYHQKYVVLDNQCKIHYDDLIITCDTKFGIPKPSFELDTWPSNYQHINNRFDKILFYHKLNIMMRDGCFESNPLQILVYGKHLQAFEFVNFLTKHGVLAKNITMVFNIDKLDESDILVSNPRHDYRIELILQQMVEDMGVKVYEYCKFSHWIMHEADTNIKSAVFDQPFKSEQLIVDCNLFISYMDVRIGHSILTFLRDNRLDVKDGRAVVDYAFRTRKPNVYAVGVCIKYGDDNIQLNLQNVSPKEMAAKLIKSMASNPQSEADFCTKYTEISYFGVCLPFDYRMAKVVSPRKCVGDHLNNEYSTSLTTYHNYEFCRVRLNRINLVEEIVVVTQKIICMDFLKYFCGKHELLLNNLYAHWFMRSFRSFLDFFQEPWSELVQHENFERLSKQNKEIARGAAEQMLNRLDLTQKQRRELLIRNLKENGVSSNVEENVLSFLRKYRQDMAGKYALPEDFPTGSEI